MRPSQEVAEILRQSEELMPYMAACGREALVADNIAA